MTDFYGRPLRSNGGPVPAGYFDDSTSYHAAETRENAPSPRREDSSSTPKRSPTIHYDKMSTASGSAVPDGVSPDLVAAITEKVKKERA